jgi:hypothetical protein
MISDRTQVLMEYHVASDCYEEERLGKASFGSTKSGIAPFYGDKYMKIGVQLCQMLDKDILHARLTNAAKLKNAMLENLYHKPLLDVDALTEKYFALAKKIEPMEEVIDDLVDDLNSRHVYRMMRNICEPVAGIRYQSILQNLEHISDQCSDLAIYIIELTDIDVIGKEHDYIHNLHHTDNPEYQKLFRENYQRFFTKLENLPFTKEGLPK